MPSPGFHPGLSSAAPTALSGGGADAFPTEGVGAQKARKGRRNNGKTKAAAKTKKRGETEKRLPA